MDPEPRLRVEKSDPKVAEKYELKENYSEILSHSVEALQNTLTSGIEHFNSLELADAAKKFRKLATDLKMLEMQISTQGNYSDRNNLNDLSGKHWLQHTKSWVIVDGHPRDINHEIKNHPASFPPALAVHFIEFFTKQGQWVFDPFMGIGSTAEACFLTQRNAFGIELNPQYADFARNRIHAKIKEHDDAKKTEGIVFDKKKNLKVSIKVGDALNASQFWKESQIPQMDLLLTSPPYWNMLKKTRGGVTSSQKRRIAEGLDEYYGDSEHDLGNIDDLQSYLATLTDYFASYKPMLKKGAYIIIILQNCRPKDGIMRPIAWDLANMLKKTYILRQEFIWCQDQKFMGIWGYPTTYVSNVHHHYCLVFQNN